MAVPEGEDERLAEPLPLTLRSVPWWRSRMLARSRRMNPAATPERAASRQSPRSGSSGSPTVRLLALLRLGRIGRQIRGEVRRIPQAVDHRLDRSRLHLVGIVVLRPGLLVRRLDREDAVDLADRGLDVGGAGVAVLPSTL